MDLAFVEPRLVWRVAELGVLMMLYVFHPVTGWAALSTVVAGAMANPLGRIGAESRA